MLTAAALKRKFPPSPVRRRAWTWTRNGTAFRLSRRRIFGTGSGRRRGLSAGQLLVVAGPSWIGVIWGSKPVAHKAERHGEQLPRKKNAPAAWNRYKDSPARQMGRPAGSR